MPIKNSLRFKQVSLEVWVRKVGSDQKQEMVLRILCLFSVNQRVNQHLNLQTTIDQKLPDFVGRERFITSGDFSRKPTILTLPFQTRRTIKIGL